ncbi:sialin-like [Planococcus citri]|uniref:sialin-like n=1 Tax=Planococcus citri TaxID=170843 RepID=UPI0031F9EBCA
MTQIQKDKESREASADLELAKELLENCNESKIENPQKYAEKYRLWFSKRFLVLILMFSGYFFAVSLKVSVNIIIIEMTTNKNITVDNEIVQKEAEFDWDSKTIGLVQGSLNYGLFFAAFGGYLATKFGGSVTYGVATAIESALTILNPMFIEWGVFAFIACRGLVGLFDGFAYASTAEVFSRWIPEKERSMFMAIIFCGVYIAVAVSYPVYGYVAYYWGWRMIFYISGGSTLIWSIIWLIIVKNEPSADNFISKKEKLYIISATETTPREEVVHPYWKIITSPAVWALGVGKLTYSFGFFIIVGCLPLYVKDVLHVDVNEVGVISSIPNFACIFMTPLAGAIMDYLQNNTKLKPNQIHKIMMTFGYTTSSILFVIVAFCNSFTVSMACFIMIKLFLSFNFLILQLVCLYLAPKHSSILLGISAFWYVISQIIMPTAVGFIVVDRTLQEWNLCFLLTAGVLMLGAIVYLIYGSSELQPWAVSDIHDKNTHLTEHNDHCSKK